MNLTQNSNAFLYGKGVFTTVAIFGGKPFLWEKHWRRLRENARVVGIETNSLDEDKMFGLLLRSIKENEIVDGRGRITLFDASASSVWSEGSESKTEVSIVAAPPRKVSESFRVGVSPHPINSGSPLAGVKSCNYLENILAMENARARGFDEAVRTNERGEVSGGCMSNIFWLADGELHTPPLSSGCLAGTTREYILEKLSCRETSAKTEDLERADALFLTSAGIGVKRVSALEDKIYAPTDHPILHLLPNFI
jgi:branched-chain amino acid aminotransferase